MPDEAWELEREFWAAVGTGDAGGFYRRYMTSDGFVVVPGALVDRQDLITRWDGHQPLRSYQLDEPRTLVVNGESILVSYSVVADADWIPDYRARVTALYTREGNGWALTFRQHTPHPAEPFPF